MELFIGVYSDSYDKFDLARTDMDASHQSVSVHCILILKANADMLYFAGIIFTIDTTSV